MGLTTRLIRIAALVALLVVAFGTTAAHAAGPGTRDDRMNATQFVYNSTPYTMHVVKKDLNGAYLDTYVRDIAPGDHAEIHMHNSQARGISVSFGYELRSGDKTVGLVDTYVEVTSPWGGETWNATNNARVYAGPVKTRWDNNGGSPYRSNYGFESNAYFTG